MLRAWIPIRMKRVLIKVATRDYKKSTKVTTEWVGDIRRGSTIGEVKWEEAKEKADFKVFQPYLEKSSSFAGNIRISSSLTIICMIRCWMISSRE